MQILKLFQCFSQSPTTTQATDDDVINDVVQYDYYEYSDGPTDKPRLLLVCFSVLFHI